MANTSNILPVLVVSHIRMSLSSRMPSKAQQPHTDRCRSYWTGSRLDIGAERSASPHYRQGSRVPHYLSRIRYSGKHGPLHALPLILIVLFQPRTAEIFRFLGILDDARKFHRDLPPFQSYKLPGGTEILKRWLLVEKFELTPDRPCVSSPAVVYSRPS